jgi:LPXTG-motif cell wall-anchored protein
VGIVNRRNAVLGWAVWKVGKRTAKRKAKEVAPTIEGGRPNKSLVAAGGVASAAGALAFWRRKKKGSDSG